MRGVRAELGSVLCLIALAGCSHTIDGVAVGEDAWHEQGVGQGLPSSPAPSASAAARPAAFDPCGLDEIDLEVGIGVDPASKMEIPAIDGCGWSGGGTGFTVALAGALPLASVATTEGVTDLRDVVVGGRTVKVFVFRGDSCAALAEVEGGVAQFSMIEEEFDPSCFRMGVAVRLVLNHS